LKFIEIFLYPAVAARRQSIAKSSRHRCGESAVMMLFLCFIAGSKNI
jgi:hypothetical protein